MPSKTYASVVELDAILAQLSEVERDQCNAEVAPQVKLYFPDTLQAKIDGLEATTDWSPLLGYAANIRWQHESHGITVNGHPIKSDADSQRKIAVLQGSLTRGDITEPIQFKLADGSFIAATAADIDAFNAGIVTHVQACFDAELAARNSILDGSTTTQAEVDAFFSGL